MLSGIIVLDLMSGFDSFLETEVYSHMRLKKNQIVGGIQIINFRGGVAVRVDGSACIPGVSCSQDFLCLSSARHEPGSGEFIL